MVKVHGKFGYRSVQGLFSDSILCSVALYPLHHLLEQSRTVITELNEVTLVPNLQEVGGTKRVKLVSNSEVLNKSQRIGLSGDMNLARLPFVGCL